MIAYTAEIIIATFLIGLIGMCVCYLLKVAPPSRLVKMSRQIKDRTARSGYRVEHYEEKKPENLYQAELAKWRKVQRWSSISLHISRFMLIASIISFVVLFLMLGHPV